MEIKGEVLAFIGGSLMPWILSFFKTKVQADNDQFTILTQKYRELYDEVKQANDDCEKKYMALIEEMMMIKAELIHLKNNNI